MEKAGTEATISSMCAGFLTHTLATQLPVAIPLGDPGSLPQLVPVHDARVTPALETTLTQIWLSESVDPALK